MQKTSPTRRRLRIGIVSAAAAVAIVAIVAVVVVVSAGTDAPPRPVETVAAVAPSPSQSPPPPAAPAQPSQQQLAALPLAFYDAVIPQLLDSSMTTPVNRWEIAAPKDPLVALYSSPAPDAAPIAALGATVLTVNTPTAVAVFGVSGDMILVSTPSRRTVPSPGIPAPSSTFAWARAADFTLTTVDRSVIVDNTTSTVSIVSASGAVSASEVARLGTPDDPTPAATFTYIESSYIDTRVAYTRGNPISLTGAHSATLAGYGGNSALTALHFYPDPTGKSHGCVRVSAAMTHALAALPAGTPIIFT
ncbi:MAG TPA: L,D-transpeptidase [Lacisediminihabitans sp.]|uniref:L,D-transpeptidase n=1 Tax=Lacisediminihabitans sp. TaxID=2787631 RepID=UPI002ED9EF29